MSNILNGKTANGVMVVFQNNTIDLGRVLDVKNDSPLLRFETIDGKTHLTEVNFDGYRIEKIVEVEDKFNAEEILALRAEIKRRERG